MLASVVDFSGLLLFLLAVWGLAYAICLGVIGAPLRAAGQAIHPYLGKFLSCPACIGFWAGLGVSLAGFGPAGTGWAGAIASGLAACGFCRWIAPNYS